MPILPLLGTPTFKIWIKLRCLDCCRTDTKVPQHVPAQSPAIRRKLKINEAQTPQYRHQGSSYSNLVAAYYIEVGKGLFNMTIRHHFAHENTTELLQRQTAIHRKCLMLLQAEVRRPCYVQPKAG